MKLRAVALCALCVLGCSGPTPAAYDAAAAPESANCVTYHFTRVLAGSGSDASVAPDGSIVAVSELAGLRSATVLDRDGHELTTFPLGPFASVVRVASGGRVVAAAADGRVRSFGADGRVRWTLDLHVPVADVLARPDGGAVVSGQAEQGVVAFVDSQGRVESTARVRAAPFLSAEGGERLLLTSRDTCSVQAPCAAGFDPNQARAPVVSEAGGVQTSALVLLDGARRTLGGFISGVDQEHPVGPVYVRSAPLGPAAVVVQATALASDRQRVEVDVDPGLAVALRAVDTETAPDRLLAFSGRSLVWDYGFEPLDDSGRAYVVGMFANQRGVVVDVNGDVYKTHHIFLLGADGALQFRYDKPNDGIANDVRLAGMDDDGHMVLSGRFEGTLDFDPGPGVDEHRASPEARRYITAISSCGG